MAAQGLASQVGVAPACRALGVSRATFYRRHKVTPGHQQPRSTPARARCESEREHVLNVLASPRFVDRAPAEVVATLLDEGQYLCSQRTMYRILAANQPVRERRHQLEHPPYTKPELVATGANETWSWDITRLLGPTRWSYFYLYVLLDIFSRYVRPCIGWDVSRDGTPTCSSCGSLAFDRRLEGRSRMRRESQVRFWEDRGVRVPSATRLVIALEDRHSGKRLLDVLGKRLGRYGLTLHEAKTRYVDFRRRRPYGRHWMASATTFDFLGFTHVWGRSMQGKDVVRQITAKGRFARALKSVHEWCKRNRHLPIEAQHDYLARAIRGHCAYYGRTGNGKRLEWFRFQVARIWRKWLARRSRLRRMNWDRMNELLKRYPLPSVSYPRSWRTFLSEPVR